jgi:hypothetical protein
MRLVYFCRPICSEILHLLYHIVTEVSRMEWGNTVLPRLLLYVITFQLFIIELTYFFILFFVFFILIVFFYPFTRARFIIGPLAVTFYITE